MSGDDFRAKVGGLVKDKEGNMRLERFEDFKSIAK